MALNHTDRHHIQMMRAAGVAYSRIAAHLDLNANSVKTYCLRHGITVDPAVEQVSDPVGVSSGKDRSSAPRPVDEPGGPPTAEWSPKNWSARTATDRSLLLARAR